MTANIPNDLDFSKICRICCSPKDTMISVFRVHISKKIMSLTSVQIWESDGLPSQICNECIVKLDVSFQFKKMCEKSDQTLRQYKTMIEQSAAPRKRKTSKREKYFKLTTTTTSNVLEELHYTDLPTSALERNTDEMLGFTYEDVDDVADMKPAEDKGYRCNTCLKVFATSTKLSRHVYLHTGHKPFQCQICNKSFSHNSNLKAHMKLHSEERPFVCSVCQKGCKRGKDLELHMRTHTGHKPHECHTCGRAFSSSSNLIAHERIHTGEKPYVCGVCHKAFCQSNELNKHRKIHKPLDDNNPPSDNNKDSNNGMNSVVSQITSDTTNSCDMSFKSFSVSHQLGVHEMGNMDL